MDILTHTLSGIAIGTVITSYSNKSFSNKFGLIAIAGFGGMLPDFDVISLWSKFDSTIGKFLGLENSGRVIYSSKFWYSHHGFLHSVVAALIIPIIFAFLFYLIKSKFKKLSLDKLLQNIKIQRVYLFSFIVGFIIHLLQDMATPSSSWGGVNFFWPVKTYIGGIGDIWWWNNYDVFLIVIIVIALNGFILASKKIIKIDIRKLTTAVFIVGLSVSIFQIKTREFNFNYGGHNSRYEEFEMKSKEIQKQILGNKLFNFMVKFDNKIPINF